MAQITNDRPICHTISKVCELTGYGPTTVWKLIADGRLQALRVPGIRRTLVSDASLIRLLAPALESEPHQPRKRGRPRSNL
jgi:excisionase family DNA binding protein